MTFDEMSRTNENIDTFQRKKWVRKQPWEVLVENIAQSNVQLVSGLEMVIEKQWIQSFKESLRAHIVAKNTEIREVCNTRYEQFITSIEDISRMKTDVMDLQQNIQLFQDELSSATSDVISCYDTLDAYSETKKQIDISITKLHQCERMIDLIEQIDAYIKQEKNSHALKYLQELEKELSHFRGQIFANKVQEWIRNATNTIKDQVRRSVSHWLEELRSTSLLIGALAIKCYNAEADGSESLSYKTRDILASSWGNQLHQTAEPNNKEFHSTLLETSRLPTLSMLQQEAQLERKRDNQHRTYLRNILERIAPMLLALHAYNEMSAASELAVFYQTNRLPQLQFSAFSRDRIFQEHETLFQKLTGSYCLELYLANYTKEMLLSKRDIRNSFKLVFTDVCDAITRSFAHLTGQKSSSILQVKNSALASARVLSNELHEYDVRLLFTTFRSLGLSFRQILFEETKSALKSFISTETFNQVQISPNTLLDLISNSGLESCRDELLQKVDRSKDVLVLPFTDIVIKSSSALKKHIYTLYDYEKEINIDDWDAVVFEDLAKLSFYLNQLLNQVLDEREDIQISMAVQISIDARFLISVTDNLDSIATNLANNWEMQAYLSSITHLSAITILEKPSSSRFNKIKTGSNKFFESTMTRAQDMVCELMLKKIDDLLSSLFQLDWTTPVETTRPVTVIPDLITFLLVTLSTFSQLPTEIQTSIKIMSYIHVGKVLHQLLCGSEIKSISHSGLANFRIIIESFSSFVKENFNVETRRKHVMDSLLRTSELVEMIEADDMQAFLSNKLDVVTMRKYPNVLMEDAIILMQKFKFTKQPSRLSKMKKAVVKNLRKTFVLQFWGMFKR